MRLLDRTSSTSVRLRILALASMVLCASVIRYNLWSQPLMAMMGRNGQTRTQQRRVSCPAAVSSVVSSRPVAVLGANGRTGRLCVEELVKLGVPVKALTRNGDFNGIDSPLVTPAKGDVTSMDTLRRELNGCRAAVFAAAYSKAAGSKPSEVDFKGLENTAEIAKEVNLERVVAVTSGAVTRPYAPVGLLLNVIGKGVLFEKKKGEESLRRILSGSGVDYTIIRPGGLRDMPALGAQKTELNQGDTVVGSVPRADVAAAVAAAVVAPEKFASGATFEMYSVDSKMEMGPRPLLPWYSLPSGYETSGPTWEEAFTGLKKDTELSPRGFY